MVSPSRSTYEVLDTFQGGDRSIVRRAIRTEDGHHVLLRAFLRPSPREVEQLRNELRIASALDVRGVVRPLGLDTVSGLPALVMEDDGGESLDHLLGAPMNVQRFLELAVRIAEAVADIHRLGVAHKQLTPSNIVVDERTGNVKLTNFGIAVTLPRVPAAAHTPASIEGALTHISPEQTGRINRPVDTRSDLYSLGVTFYEMLTGKLPCVASDPLEWVHCHIAASPDPPSAVVPSVPAIVSAIVMELLAKSADHRYQSASGLQHDLERCLAEIRATGRIEPFVLKARDMPERLLVPQKLYGRSAALAKLVGLFDHVVTANAPVFVVVSGPSGVGKSSLVQEVRERIIRARGVFACGKFEQLKRAIPYATIAQASRELVLDILAEREERIAIWRQRLEAALGLNAGLLVDLVPELERVMGPQPPVPELPLTDAQRRFERVFVEFIRVFARAEHPTALFFDDLQWADSASLKLLSTLAKLDDVRSLLLIGACRDDPGSAWHRIVLAAGEARKAGATVESIALEPLTELDTRQLIADAIHKASGDVASLAELVHEKTAGNPFFVIQFLTELEAEGLLAFDARARSWNWDIDRIRAKNYTDNAIELMVAKLGRLSPRARETVALASCLGNTADTATLALLGATSVRQVEETLDEVVREGLLAREDGAYVFPHDRVRAAAYALTPADAQRERHSEIGWSLLARATPAQRSEHIFDIAVHLNQGRPLEDAAQRIAVADVNRQAGERAMATAAFGAAAAFFQAGIDQLGPDGFERSYELAFALHLQKARSELSAARHHATERLIEALLRSARGRHHRSLVYLLQITLYTLVGKAREAVKVALDASEELFGIRVDPNPSDERVRDAIAEVMALLDGRTNEMLVEAAPMSDPDMRDAAAIFVAAFSAIHFAGERNLYDVMSCHLARITLQHGSGVEAPLAYVKLGHFAIRQRLPDEARRLGEVAKALADRSGLPAIQAQLAGARTAFITAWLCHPREALAEFERASKLAAKVGDLTHEVYAHSYVALCALMAGLPISEAASAAARAAAVTQRTVLAEPSAALTELLARLQGSRAPRAARYAMPFSRYYQCVFALIDCIIEDDAATALELAAEARTLLPYAHNHVECTEYWYYAGLAYARAYDTATSEEQPTLRAQVAAHVEQLARCVKVNPVMFANRHALLAAELARIDGRSDVAMRLYEDAVRSAEEHCFLHNQAIACEAAARFYGARGLDRFELAYLAEARSCYARWGAATKVAALDERFPGAANAAAAASLVGSTQRNVGAETFAARTEQLDLLSVIKASQSVSGEIVLGRLVRALMRILLATGGAQRGCLLLVAKGTLFLEAEATFEGSEIAVRLDERTPAAALVPMAVVNSALHTREPVVLDDAASSGRFVHDPWIAARKTRSVLCLPIIRQADVVGVLYLENNLFTGAFTPDRIAVLQLLAAQAAISLQNAQLLEQEQAARTLAEEAERRASFLAQASKVLGTLVESDEVLRQLAHLAVQHLCDWCVIDIIETGELRRAIAAHANPALQPTLDDLRRRFPLDRDPPALPQTAMSTSESLVIPELTREKMREFGLNDEQMDVLIELGSRSALSVPLLARGQTLGAITLVSGQVGRYGKAEVDLGRELAHRAAIAIDNTRLYRETREAVRRRDEFMSIASHELNTPITSLQLMMQALTRGVVPPSAEHVQRAFAMADRQLRRLTRLVGELLDVSRIQRGGFELALERIDLGALTREVSERFEQELTRAAAPLSVDVRDEVSGMWDRSKLEQVIANFLSNAIKFGRGNAIEVVVERTSPSHARVTVSDHGIGIAPERLPRVFDRFERAVSAREYGGLGLGLYIVRSVAEAHGGSVGANSEPGVGSTFWIELPCAGPRVSVSDGEEQP